MKWLILGIGLLCSTACGSGNRATSGTGFCVPAAYAISNVGWAPSDTDHAGDVAFRGCETADEKCVLPKEVSSGLITARAVQVWKWEGLAADSFYRRVAVEGSPRFELSGDSRTLTLSNPSLSSDLYVWRKAASADGGRGLTDGDELLAVCRLAEQAGRRTEPWILSCDRHVQGKNYGLQYTFKSTGHVPQEIQAMDSKIFAQVDSWRCKKD